MEETNTTLVIGLSTLVVVLFLIIRYSLLWSQNELDRVLPEAEMKI